MKEAAQRNLHLMAKRASAKHCSGKLLRGHVSFCFKHQKSHCFAMHRTCLLLMALGAGYQMKMLYPSVDLFDALFHSQQRKGTPHGKQHWTPN